MEYTVTVGNVGTLYLNNLKAAEKTFEEYCELCRSGNSRAEFPVVLFDDNGEIMREDYGPAADSVETTILRVFPLAEIDLSDEEETFATVPFLGDFRFRSSGGAFEVDFRHKGAEAWETFSGYSARGALLKALIVTRTEHNRKASLIDEALALI